MTANSDSDDGERVLSDREEIRSWAEETGSRPMLSATSDGAMNLQFAGEGDDAEGRVLDWDSFFSLFETSDMDFVVDDSGRERFVDENRMPDTGDEDEVHPDADRRDLDAVDRETDQMEREARETNNPDNHRDEEPFQS